MRQIRLAVVDDSAFVRKALCRILETEEQIRVVGTAETGEELLAQLAAWRPEVITLDLSMPGMGGLATLDRIMATRPVPVIILSTHSAQDAPLTIEALHRGAVDFIDKQSYSLVDFDQLRQVLVAKILQVAGVTPQPARVAAAPPSPGPSPQPVTAPADAPYDLVLIGASTGGPPAIQRILGGLQAPLIVPLAMVQHMPEGFIEAFACRLDNHLPFPVTQTVHGEPLRPGSVYLAAAGKHLRIDRKAGDLVTVHTASPARMAHRPSIDVLFESVVPLCAGGLRVIALLLTGMGRDGAAGMAKLAHHGAHTIGQSEASCVVYGMPRAARELGAVREELPLGSIASRISELLALDVAKKS